MTVTLTDAELNALRSVLSAESDQEAREDEDDASKLHFEAVRALAAKVTADPA